MASSSDLAQLAQSLKDNEAWNAALDIIRANALDALATIDADDKFGIVRNQAIVKVADDLRAGVDQFIRSGQPRKPAGLA